MQKLTPEQRREQARAAAKKRWAEPNNAAQAEASNIPTATHWGELEIGEKVLPCYRLASGERIFQP